jgi:hypothetical protein
MADAPDFSLDDFMQQRWQALASRLGERRSALLQSIEEKTGQLGFSAGLQAARFANLCLALGPGFETRPENEWALAILLNDKLEGWVKLHQLVLLAATALRRRGGEAEAQAQLLLDNDRVVLDRFDVPARPTGRRPQREQPTRLRRVACDFEAAELRLLDTGFRQEYRLQGGQWQRVAVEGPAPVRIDAQHPAPERITVLTRIAGEEAPVRLQVRTVHHGRCGLGLHPSVTLLSGRDVEARRDEAARAPVWPVSAPPVKDLPGLIQTPEPDISLLKIQSCSLRNEGVPLGDVQMQLWAYAAQQVLLTQQREARMGFALPDPKSSPPAVQPTKLVFERDGVSCPVDAWQRGFDESLRAALDQGLQDLLKAWQKHVQEPSLKAEIRLFDGKAALTWGWREGPRGLASPPVERAVADIDWLAGAELALAGMVEYAGAKAHLRLHVEGEARLQTLIERLHAEVPLFTAMEGSQLKWRWPVRLDFDPMADDSGIVFREVGPCTGALSGTLGLRVSASRGGAWEWFATMALEPVATRVVVHDPLLGGSESHLALLGSVALLDWSLA